MWKPVVSFKRFFKIPKTKGGIKWLKLFLERNHFTCFTTIYFGTSFVLDLYKWLAGWLAVELKMTRSFSLLFMMLLQVSLSLIANISKWAFKWKITFNSDPSKPAQEVIFSRKLKAIPSPSITFNPLRLPCSKSFGIGFRFEINV